MTQASKVFCLVGLLLVPLIAVQTIHTFSVTLLVVHLLFTCGIVLGFLSSGVLKTKLSRILRVLFVVLYFIYLFLLLFEVSLFDFSGRGFTNEVYFHFEMESLRIGFTEYPLLIIGFVVLVLVYVFIINHLTKSVTHLQNKAFIIVAMVVVTITAANSSITRFTQGYMNYLWQEPVELNQELLDRYIELGILQNSQITSKKQLEATANTDAKNLILIYLESFNEGLLNLDQYPDLTPRLNELSRTYQSLNHYNSSYVTIEGIISSQCGTMLPMTAGNNTFLNSGELMSNLPCLGDILNVAGYTQYYLGGAQMEFAGKGKFFEVHEYDYIWGLEHWKANGLKETSGVWGLSDTQLFQHVIDTIKKAAQNPPYNVTALTLGTHLPGYVYETCTPYKDSDEPFVQALHCTDRLVGRFVDELEKAQLLDDAVLMIIADHGIFPTPKMKELFGDVVTNRKLIAITNHPEVTDKQFSSFDLAPTLLDMMNVQHNAEFLYGQSLFEAADVRPLVTRYEDWHEDKMIWNPNGECRTPETLVWPLNLCEKWQLRDVTNSLLDYYSIKTTPEPLSCEIDIRFRQRIKADQNKAEWALEINDLDHFDHFYHKGYLLQSLNYRAGVFVFVLNQDLAIVEHIFMERNDQTETQLEALIKDNENALLVVESTLKHHPADPNIEQMALQVDFIKKQLVQWTESRDYDVVKGVNICQ